MDNRSYLDIIFDGFTKSYGAYLSRVHIATRTLLSFIGALILFAAVLYPLVPKPLGENDSNKLKVKQRKVVQYSQLSAPPPIDLIENKPPKKKPIEQKIASKKFVKPTVKPDDEIEEEEFIPSQEDLKYINPGIKDQEGDSILYNVMDDGAEVDVQYDLNPEPAPAPKPKPAEEEIFTFVEKSAEFPGGMKEVYKFLGKHLIYPDVAKENGIDGRVVIQFVVEKDGSVTNIEIVRDIGGGCGEEAKRVVTLLPTWVPAEQNGLTVRSKYTLPVKFKLEDYVKD